MGYMKPVSANARLLATQSLRGSPKTPERSAAGLPKPTEVHPVVWEEGVLGLGLRA